MKWLMVAAVVVTGATWALRARRGRRRNRGSSRWSVTLGAVLAALLWVAALVALSRAL